MCVWVCDYVLVCVCACVFARVHVSVCDCAHVPPPPPHLPRPQVDPPGTAKGPGLHMLLRASDTPREVGDGAKPRVVPTVVSRRSRYACPDRMVWIPWFKAAGRVGTTRNFSWVRFMLQVHFADDNVRGESKMEEGQSVEFYDEGAKMSEAVGGAAKPARPPLPRGPVTASTLPAAVIVMVQDTRLSAPSVGRIEWSEFTAVFRRLLERREQLKGDGLFAALQALPAEAVAEALAWITRVQAASDHPIVITATARVEGEASGEEGLDDVALSARPPFRLLSVDGSTPLPPKPSLHALNTLLCTLQPVVINSPVPMAARGTRARHAAIAVQGDDDVLVTVPKPSQDVAIVASSRGKIRSVCVYVWACTCEGGGHIMTP